MANPFYTKTFDVTPGNLVRSQTLEDQFLLVEQGFDTVNTNLVTKASPTTTGTGSHTGNFTITGNETVTGGLSVGGSETVTGGMSVGTSLSVGTNLTVGGSETVTGGMSVGGAITAGGKVTAGAGPSASLDLTTKDYVDSLVTATAFSTSLPLQSGNAGKFVTTNGTSASWAFAGIAQVTTATTATTLTNTPTLLQITPSACGITVTLPNATTCSVGGPLHCIDNRGDYPVRLVDNTAALVGFVAPKSTCYISLDNNSTAAGVWATGLPKVGWAAMADLSSAAAYNGSPIAVALDTDRTFLSWAASGTYYACVYRLSTNTFSTPTLVRTVVSASCNQAVLCGTNAVLMVTCPSSGTAIQGVVLSIDASTDAITVNTAANATAPAAVSAFSTLTNVFVAVPGASGSYVLSYYATNGYIQAFSVSGTTVTIGSTTTLGGNSGVQWILASGDKVLAVSANVGTTTGYYNVYTISGTTISAGTGGTVSSINYPATFVAWGSRWLVLWQSSTNTVVASLLSLSGTTLTASTVTAVCGTSSTAIDAMPVGASKYLVVGNYTTGGAGIANIITDTAGTLSVGTAITTVTGNNQRGVAWVSGNNAFVVEATAGGYLLDCSGASPTLTRTYSYTANTLIPYSGHGSDGYGLGVVFGATYSFAWSQLSSNTLYNAVDSSLFVDVPSVVLPQTKVSTSTRYFGYQNKRFFFTPGNICLMECVA